MASYKQCVSDCITRAAMLSPPVLHFVILSLGSCSPAFEVLQNSLWLFIKVEKKSFYCCYMIFRCTFNYFCKTRQACVLLLRQLTRWLITLLFTLKYVPKKTKSANYCRRMKAAWTGTSPQEEGCVLFDKAFTLEQFVHVISNTHGRGTMRR